MKPGGLRGGHQNVCVVGEGDVEARRADGSFSRGPENAV